MKMLRHPLPASGAATGRETAGARYQIYCQLRQGVFAPGFQTDCASEAVTAFLRRAPAFTGGEVRIWHRSEQRMVAAVQWQVEINGFGFFVYRRLNVFYDRLLERIARQIGGSEQRLSPVPFLGGIGRRSPRLRPDEARFERFRPAAVR